MHNLQQGNAAMFDLIEQRVYLTNVTGPRHKRRYLNSLLKWIFSCNGICNAYLFEIECMIIDYLTTIDYWENKTCNRRNRSVIIPITEPSSVERIHFLLVGRWHYWRDMTNVYCYYQPCNVHYITWLVDLGLTWNILKS